MQTCQNEHSEMTTYVCFIFRILEDIPQQIFACVHLHYVSHTLRTRQIICLVGILQNEHSQPGCKTCSALEKEKSLLWEQNDALSAEVSNIAATLRECAKLSCKRPRQSAERNNGAVSTYPSFPWVWAFSSCFSTGSFHQCGSNKFKARGCVAGQSVWQWENSSSLEHC